MVSAGTGPSAARKCPILDFYVSIHSLAISAGQKAGSLSTNTVQSVDRLSTNKADLKRMQVLSVPSFPVLALLLLSGSP